MRSSMFLQSFCTLALMAGCSGTSESTDIGTAATGPATGSSTQPLAAASANQAKTCLAHGPKAMDFQSGSCGSGFAHMEYLFYGSDGSGSGSFSDSSSFTPNTDFTGGTVDTSFACDPMTFSVTAIGPSAMSSDKEWTFFSMTEAAFVQMWVERTGYQPLPERDYFSFTALQFMMDSWSCDHTVSPGAGICPSNASPVTFTKEVGAKSYTAGSILCTYSFTIAQRT